MLRIGLTGGIASGKSTVAARLRARGAVVVDADLLARAVVAPGTAGLAAVVRRFGDEVLTPDGTLDRAALGRLVFADGAARAALEGIIHPLVRAAGDDAEGAADPDAVVVHDIPLLYEKGYAPTFHAVLVVEADPEERLRRMISTRGMDRDDALARLAAQATDEERRRVADIVLPGEDSLDERLRRVDRLWAERLVPWASHIARRVPADGRAGAPARHDPAWRDSAARQLRRFRHVVDEAGLAHALLGLDHVGATSVPGLAAPPVIELQVRVRTWEVAAGARMRDAMARAGFFPLAPHPVHATTAAGLAPGARTAAFAGSDPAQPWLAHVRVHAGEAAQEALLLRDHLRADANARDRAARGIPEDVASAWAWARRAGWRGTGPG